MGIKIQSVSSASPSVYWGSNSPLKWLLSLKSIRKLYEYSVKKQRVPKNQHAIYLFITLSNYCI